MYHLCVTIRAFHKSTPAQNSNFPFAYWFYYTQKCEQFNYSMKNTCFAIQTKNDFVNDAVPNQSGYGQSGMVLSFSVDYGQKPCSVLKAKKAGMF